MFKFFSKKQPQSEAAWALYETVVKQSRREEFFTACGVPDSVDGRFDLLLLHAFLLFHRMKSDHETTKQLSQEVFDLMFANLDLSLREMGVGDMGIGRRIKGMARAFYGRVQAYEEGVESGDPDRLEEAIRRNLFRKCDPSDAAVAAVAGYIREQTKALEAVPTSEIMTGKIEYGAPPGCAR